MADHHIGTKSTTPDETGGSPEIPHSDSHAPSRTVGPKGEDNQEYRAYLQRGETRLSTLHRVAGAFLGGAGLLTLLPVLFRDTFSSLLSEILFLGGKDLPPVWSPERLLAFAPITASLLLPLWALYLLMSDLIRFYFTGHHFGSPTGTVYPRFILSGILVAEDSLADREKLDQARLKPAVTDLLVPKSDVVKRRLLREARNLSDSTGITPADIGRRDGIADYQLRHFIFDYTASLKRSLAEESAKMEASLARHLIRLRVLVMRYAKAFLLTILTTGVTITALVVLNLARPDIREGLGQPLHHTLISGALVWSCFLAVYAGWCLVAAWLVRRPIIWIYDDLGDENVLHRTPESLLQFETVTLIVVVLSNLCVAAATWIFALRIHQPNLLWIAGLTTGLLIFPNLVYVGQSFRDNYIARRRV